MATFRSSALQPTATLRKNAPLWAHVRTSIAAQPRVFPSPRLRCAPTHLLLPLPLPPCSGLCTVGELEGNVGSTGDCATSNALHWSLSECDDDGSLAFSCTTAHNVKPVCQPKARATAKVRCCADVKPYPADHETLSVVVREWNGLQRTVWSSTAGNDAWLEASASLGVTSSTIPFQVELVSTSSGNGAGVVAVDDVSFEGCFVDTTKQAVDEVRIIDWILNGEPLHVLGQPTWGKDAKSQGYLCKTDPCQLIGGKGSVTGREGPQPEDQVLVGADDFTVRLEFSMGQSTELSLAFEGGSADGHVTINPGQFSADGVLFGGESFTGAHKSLVTTHGTLVVQRQQGTLTVLLDTNQLHAYSIGDLALGHVTVKASTGAKLFTWVMQRVVDSAPPPRGDAVDTRSVDIPIRDVGDDLSALVNGGQVFSNMWRLPLAYGPVPKSQPPRSAKQVIALRFDGLPVSRDSVITAAHVQFTALANSGHGMPTLTITAERNADSKPFDTEFSGVPRLNEDGKLSGTSQMYFLHASYSNQDACKLLGGTWVKGSKRVNARTRVCRYWQDGKLQGPPTGQNCKATAIPYIRTISCKLAAVQPGALDQRTKSQTVQSWSPAPWVKGERGEAQRTADISALLMEVTRLQRWRAGNAVTLFVQGDSDQYSARTAYGFDNPDKKGAPTLHLEVALAETSVSAGREAICVFPFLWNGRLNYRCLTSANPTQSSGDVSPPWCGTSETVDKDNFGFCTSHVVTVHGGKGPAGSKAPRTCAFPFTYRGKTYTDCVRFDDDNQGRDGAPWCSTTIDYDDDGLWGYCDVPTYGGTSAGNPCNFPFWYGGQEYFECTTDGGRGGDEPWCLTTGSGADVHSTAEWGYCGHGSETVKSWGYTCDCPAGYDGLLCEQPCSGGTFGENCAERCDCEHGECDSVSGACRCFPGWRGDTCDTPDATHTFSCEDCANELPTRSCKDDPEPTHCYCRPGWKSPYCDQGCDPGFWGNGCGERCDCGGGVCNPESGACDECPAGYTGPSCGQKCPGSTYGVGCDQECKCLNGGLCDHRNGACTCPPGTRGALCQTTVAQQDEEQVFVNELHYNNKGVDRNERIEIAAPAGTDLANYLLEFYNGAGATGSILGRVPLEGIVPNLEAGMGVLSFEVKSTYLQNAGNTGGDGFALVKKGTATKVIQLLSYGGSFVVTAGAAKGMTSTDIGVEEDATTRPYDSLQLIGSGDRYGEFSWAPKAIPSTFGAKNRGQTFQNNHGSVSPLPLAIPG